MKYTNRNYVSDIIDTDKNVRLLIYKNDDNNIIPQNIVRLILPYIFNDKLDNIHYLESRNNLDQHINLLWHFNQYVDNLPNSIRLIHFGKTFNKSINNLPLHLNKLKFSYDFKKPLNKIPKNLKVLKIDYNYDYNLPHLPQSLHTLKLYLGNNIIDILPETLRVLIIDTKKYIQNYPPKLYTLRFGNYFNQEINNLPQTLYELELGYCFNQSLDFLPESLQILNLRMNNKIKKINDLPSSIKKVVIRKSQSNLINPIYHNKVVIKKIKDRFSILYGK